MPRAPHWFASVLLLAAGAGSCSKDGSTEASRRGREVFQACVACHGPDGLGNRGLGASAIAGLDSWYVAAQLRKFQSGVRGSHPDDAEGARMRGVALGLRSERDLVAVAERVAQLPPEPQAALVHGDTVRGRRLWASCAPCHGAGASGSSASGAPPLNLANDWYLLGQLDKFRRGQRGAHPDDVTGAMMRSVALGLPDEAALRDVVAYLARSR